MMIDESAALEYKRRAERMAARALASGRPREGQMFLHAAEQLVEHENSAWFEFLSQLTQIPVPIEEFTTSKEFMGGQLEVWPALMDDLRAMNPDQMLGQPPVYEALLGGATGTGKTTVSMVTCAYQLYCLSCLHKPQRIFGLMPSTAIVMVFTSVSHSVANRVIYKPFRDMFLGMPWSQRWLKWNKDKDSVLQLSNGVEVEPILANTNTIIGQAIIGGIVDEVNFMSVVERSKKVAGARGEGGKFDQAERLYTTLVRRRKSRFITKGPSPGVICTLSSIHHKEDFLSRRIRWLEQQQQPGVVFFQHKQYEVQPADKYSGETFKIIVGTDDYSTRVLTEEDEVGVSYPSTAQIEEVPVEYYDDFCNDPENALRDVVGIASAAISPYIVKRQKVVDAMARSQQSGQQDWIGRDITDLGTTGLLPWLDSRIVNPNRPHYVHIDLSVSRDRCGVAVAAISGISSVARGEDIYEKLPVYAVVAATAIEPSAMADIDIAEIRRWVLLLKTMYGVNIAAVSYDGYQSTESIQSLRKSGIFARKISVDRTTEPYDHLRSCLYEDRVNLPNSTLLHQELVQLTHDKVKGKIDHLPNFSKDLADAVAGAVYSASLDRQIRADGFGMHDEHGAAATGPESVGRPAPMTRVSGTERR